MNTTESSSMNVEYKKQRRSKLDQLHGWRMQGMKPEEHQENETGDNNTTAPTDMYLPDLDNTPLSQALKNGLDWGVGDEVMVECPKLKQYFGVDTFLIQRISGRIC